jgi:chaperone BCS1
MGIPYTLGIGLCGPPGTGKTSVIKAISKLLDRHIIVFSLKLIKTRKQLTEFFYEERYNYENKKRSIPFDKKIIVIEDIDCIGDIVKNRELIEDQKQQKKDRKKMEQHNTENIIQTILDNVEDANKTCVLPAFPVEDEPITLDDILNLWDGIRETPGRVLIISSNHYEQLDPALIRPGRIDIRLELSYVSHVIISEFYSHFFKKKIDPFKLFQVKEYFYTPCEITNIYITHNRDETQFMERLIQNKRIHM